MTLAGDGLMDALALKQADIGIAAEAGGINLFTIKLRYYLNISWKYPCRINFIYNKEIYEYY